MNEMSYPREHETALSELIDITHEYGQKPEYALGGGGNTSWKDEHVLHVKASGSALATLSRREIVAMDTGALDRIWSNTYPEDQEERESQVLRDLLDARLPDQGDRRPSVETLLHALFPFTFVVHTHPTKVNGVTCSRRGQEVTDELFGADALWIPCIEPGYVLAKAVREGIDERVATGLPVPQLLFLQNHGVFVAANSVAEIRALYESVMTRIEDQIEHAPSAEVQRLGGDEEAWLSKALPDYSIRAFVTDDILRYAASDDAFAPLKLSLTPDHIVYYGYRPLYVTDRRDVATHIDIFRGEDDGRAPRIIVVKDVGAFACAEQPRSAELAEQLFLDGVKIAVYAENFGGAAFMPDTLIAFIRNWEVEKYRASVTK